MLALKQVILICTKEGMSGYQRATHELHFRVIFYGCELINIVIKLFQVDLFSLLRSNAVEKAAASMVLTLKAIAIVFLAPSHLGMKLIPFGPHYCWCPC